MSEIRHDRISGDWSIIAPERGRRLAARLQSKSTAAKSPWAGNCPFCPGNEKLLPSIIQETPLSSAPGWQVRVVPNRYPAVGGDGERASGGTVLYESFPGSGRHEVIIEHPGHDQDLATMPQRAVLAVLETYRARHRALMDDSGIASVILFRNHGGNAGASIGHPHSQAIGLAMIPPAIQDRAERSRRYHRREARCPICDMIVREREEGRRLIMQSEHFLACVPFAAVGSLEIRLVPLAHGSRIRAVSDEELRDLSAVLRRILSAYRHHLGNPEYNMVLHSAPRELEQAPYLHWQLQILPRRSTAGGFEFGSGIRINPSVPEDDAALLARAVTTRDVDIPRRHD